MREHALAGDTEYKGSEGNVISWLTLSPHTSPRVNFRRLYNRTLGKSVVLLTIHYFVDFSHACDNLLHANIESFAVIGLACVKG